MLDDGGPGTEEDGVVGHESFFDEVVFDPLASCNRVKCVDRSRPVGDDEQLVSNPCWICFFSFLFWPEGPGLRPKKKGLEKD